MTRTVMIGGLPLHSSGSNKGRLDRNATAAQLGWTIGQVSKAYNNWIQVFRMSGSTLTFEQYINKMKETGILPEDVSNHIGGYHLARYGDEGPYTNESCRFILTEDNLQEQRDNGRWSSPYSRTVAKYGEARTREILRYNGSLAQ
jgi:hypothetical protein